MEVSKLILVNPERFLSILILSILLSIPYPSL
jgi:hypothetical protein